MAVVQISKIQVRRGQKLSGIGIPQLSSAEFAWAVDTQELYIGNGSVAEGAPYVGNTKVLTEHDNILELASSYRFASVDPSISLSISRTLQSKLDEHVSILDFGAVPDGSTDCLASFQNALNQLFRNPDDKFKKTLLIPNGVYLLTGNLNVPSTAKIAGETRDGAVLEIGDNNILFVTEDGEGVANFNSSNRPRNVSISNLTISHNLGELVLTGLADSSVTGVRFKSSYVLGDSIGAVESHPASIFWENSLPGTKVTDIRIDDCLFESTALAIRSDQITVDSSSPPNFETHIDITNCKFYVCDSAIVINGIASQGNKWHVDHCHFEEISQYAFRASYGRGTLIRYCTLTNCGNLTNTAAYPVSEMIYFGESEGNRVIECSTNRHQSGGIVSVSTVDAKVEVYNSSLTSLNDQYYSDIFLSDSFRPLAVLSAFNRFTYVDYTLRLNNHVRAGRLTIMVDATLGEYSFADNYTYSTPFATSPGGVLMTNFQFQAELKDNDLDSGIETLLLSYQNPISTGAIGTISYSVTYGV